MDLSNVSERGNVEDRRGGAGPTVIGGGLATIVVALVAGALGINPQIANKLFQAFVGARLQQPQAGPGKQDGYKEFASAILGSCNAVWKQELGRNYQEPTLVLFDSPVVQTGGCGNVPSEAGPFYCPGDKQLYVNPAFFEVLEKQLGGSKAQFSQGFVIAHEVGHHIQNLLGYNDAVERFRKSEGENGGIRLELQADYLAGCWAHHGQKKFRFLADPGRDLQEALRTAQSIGDDAIMQKMNPRARADSRKFNHGTADQRVFFFRKGFETGDASKAQLDKFFNPNVRPLDLGVRAPF
jgi:predicted metalloprotease